MADSSAADAFVLGGGELRAGDYVYELVQVGQDWYLQSLFSEASEEELQSIPTMRTYSLILLTMMLCFAGAAGVRVRVS